MATPMPYISTSSPLPTVMLVNVPFLLLWYRALRDFRPRGVQSLLLIRRMSGQPSPSASKKAAPAPKVSGRNFLPARPLLWVNLIPAALVMSVNFTSLEVGTTVAAAANKNTGTNACAADFFILFLQGPQWRQADFSSPERARAACLLPEAGRCRDREWSDAHY